MKIPRMTVRRLMLAVLAFAFVWGAVRTASRRESYRLKASDQALREKQIRSFQDGWTAIEEIAAKLLKSGKGRRDGEDFDRLNKIHYLLVNNYVCSSIDNSIDFVPFDWFGSPEVVNLDDRLRKNIATARKNLGILEPRLVYHQTLRHKYERAMSRPWQLVPPDPPMPRYPLPQ